MKKILFSIIFFIIVLLLAVFYFKVDLKKIAVKEKPKTFSETPPKVSMREEKIKISLYFSSLESDHLVIETREIYKTASIIDQIKQSLIFLIAGPVTDLVPVIPDGVVLKEVYVDKRGTCYVDFSQELVKNHPGGSNGEIMTIYGIVDTLCANFREIKRVQILVDGKEIETIAGHIDTSGPFSMKNI